MSTSMSFGSNVDQLSFFTMFSCGLLRGALYNLGYPCSVTAEVVDPNSPSCAPFCFSV